MQEIGEEYRNSLKSQDAAIYCVIKDEIYILKNQINLLKRAVAILSS